MERNSLVESAIADANRMYGPSRYQVESTTEAEGTYKGKPIFYKPATRKFVDRVTGKVITQKVMIATGPGAKAKAMDRKKANKKNAAKISRQRAKRANFLLRRTGHADGVQESVNEVTDVSALLYDIFAMLDEEYQSEKACDKMVEAYSKLESAIRGKDAQAQEDALADCLVLGAELVDAIGQIEADLYGYDL